MRHIFLLLLMVPMLFIAQNPGDLHRNLRTAKNDIERADALNALADHYKSVNPDSIGQYALQALELSQKIKYRMAEGSARLNLGNAAIISGNYKLAMQHFTAAQSVLEALLATGKDEKAVRQNLARAYGSIGIVFSEQSSYARALQFHLKSVKIYEQLGDKARAAKVYNNIGIVYQAQGEEFRALEYFLKCLKIQELSNDPSSAITLTNIGNIYRDQKEYEKALQYYTKARGTFIKHPDFRGLGELFNNLALLEIKRGNTDDALEFCNLALESFGKIGDKFGSSDAYALLGEIYFGKADYAKALENAEKSLQLGKELGIRERIRDSEKMLSAIYEKTGKPGLALEHYRNFTAAADSVSNYRNLRNSIREEMNFEFEKKEALQKKEAEKRELVFGEQSKRHRMQVVFTALLVLLLSGIVFLIYSRRQLRKNLTLQKELAEYEQKALHLQMNPHFVFNCLGSISSFIVQNGTDSAIRYLSKFSKLMRLTLEYSKESAIPIDKEIESLQNYLELEQLRFNNVFTFEITKSADIEDDMALPPLLLQPFVENAIIHGLVPKKEPGHVRINFEISGQSLICTVQDDGIGIDKSNELKRHLVSVHKSMALDITRKRLEMMGSVTDKSSKVTIEELKDANGDPSGTKVILQLPIQYTSR